MESWDSFAFLRQIRFSSPFCSFPTEVQGGSSCSHPFPSSFHMSQLSGLHWSFSLNPWPILLLFSCHITTFEKEQTYNLIIIFNKVGKFMYIIYQFWNAGHIGCESILFHLNCILLYIRKDSTGIVLNEINML